MALSPIKKRSRGYELSGFEKALIYNKEKYPDTGFVRFKNQANGIFYLDPSHDMETPENKVYFINPVQAPSKGQFVQVTVEEKLKPYYEEKRGVWTKTEIYRISAWHELELNDIIGPKNINLEEFLNCLVMPIRKGDYDIEDIAQMFGLFTVACPPLTDFTQGGIDVLIQSKFYDNEKQTALNRIGQVIPKEYMRLNARNFYQIMGTVQRPLSGKSKEVSLEFFNTPSVPAHININFDVNFRSYTSYKEDFNIMLPAARSYMLDALMFQPRITDDYLKNFQEAMQTLRDAADTKAGDTSATPLNYADTLPRLATSFARLNFQEGVSREDIKKGLELYLDSTERAYWSAAAARKYPGYYNQTADEKRMLAEINRLKDIGFPVTIHSLRVITTVPAAKFEKTLDKLRRTNFIYLPGNDRIEIIEE